MTRTIRAPRGTELSCRSWQTEAALRMLMNNLDPEVAERPQDLVVYGGIGKAARNWECFDAIVECLRDLRDDETLLVQSGKPVAVFKTHADAPRVLIANSKLVPAWANWEHFHELDRKGLMMYGQMTAGSWIYIGTQGILQGTYETFAEAARQHFGGSLRGRLVVTAGLGGMGGAQPLAATMNEGVCWRWRSTATASSAAWRRATSTSPARASTRPWPRPARPQSEGRALSIGLLGNAADVLPELLQRGVVPDLLTDQTSAHDPLNGYVPNRMAYEAALELRQRDPQRYMAEARRSDGRARAGHARAAEARRRDLRLRQQHPRRGPEGRRQERLRLSRLRAGLHPAAVLRGQGPLPLGRALGRSGRHRGHRRGRARDLPPGRRPAALDHAGPRARGLPGAAGAHLLAGLRRARQDGPALQRAGARAARSRPRS